MTDGRFAWCGEPGLPRADLFVKPIDACGGTGAERSDHDGGHYVRPDGLALTAEQLAEHLGRRSLAKPLLIQSRLRNHPALSDLCNDALATVRIVTCLDERERPETIGAVFRMAIGGNRTVDNLHAGGIASQVARESGSLSPATNLGMDARLGWLTRHPGSGAPIAGRVLPSWQATCALAERAHLAFADRVIIGWDIAVLPDGPCLVEGNSAPDVDIMQRHGNVGLGSQRFGALLAWHLGQSAVAVAA